MPAYADLAALQGTLDHWQQVLQQIGFLDPAVPKKLMPRLQQLALRAALTEPEVHILRGMARAIDQAARAAGAAPAAPAAIDGRHYTGLP